MTRSPACGDLAGSSKTHELEAGGLSREVIDAFVAGQQRAGRQVRLPTVVGARAQLLRSVEAAPAAVVVVAPSPLDDELIGEYRHWLVTERSLAALTVYNYMHLTRRFLAATCNGEVGVLLSFTAGDLADYLRIQCRRFSARSVNEIVVALRSLFRFLYLRGHIDSPLAQALPWMASGRASSLPRVLPAGHAELLLASCDRATLTGQRDFAILTVLIRLGLRRGEVAALKLCDIDWRAGEIVVAGKGAWRDQLPLPVDVGEAIASYLEMRGPGPRRGLFVHVVAPRGPITSSDVGAIVRRACGRSGFPTRAPTSCATGSPRTCAPRGAAA